MALLSLGAVTGLLGSLALAGGTADGSVAASLVAQLERDEGHRTLVADPLKRAKDAMERAVRFRGLGDEPRARLADTLAKEWAETARDLVAAADSEAKAAETRTAAIDAGASMERERALLEEGIGRAGRLRAEYEAAEREARETNRTATPVDAGPAKRQPKRAGRAVPAGGEP